MCARTREETSATEKKKENSEKYEILNFIQKYIMCKDKNFNKYIKNSQKKNKYIKKNL